MSKVKKKAFEYLVLFHEEIVKEYGVQEISTKMIVAPKVIIAENEQNARFLAQRDIPEVYASNPEWIEVLVRPF